MQLGRASTWFIAAAAAASVACFAEPPSSRRLLAVNDTWRVSAEGHLDAPGTLVHDAVTDFVVETKDGAYARGPLYVAGGNDTAFNGQFPNAVWLSRDVLMLFYPPASKPRATTATVQNASAQMISWLTIETGEILLILRIAPNASIEVPLWQMSDLHGFFVRAEFAGGQRLSRHYRIGIPRDDAFTLQIDRAGEISVLNDK